MALLCGTKKTLAVSTMNVHSPMPGIQEALEELQKLGTGSHTRGMMEHITLVMTKLNRGYGFSIHGECPAKVSKLEAGSASDKAGLRQDDFIIRINGQNVSKLTSEMVGILIRKTEKKLVLDVHRYQSYPNPASRTDIGVNACFERQRLSDASSDSGQGSLSPSEGHTHEHTQTHVNKLCTQAPWLIWQQRQLNPWHLYREMKDRQSFTTNDCDTFSEYSDTESCYSCSTLSMADSDTTATGGMSPPPMCMQLPQQPKKVSPPVPPRKPKFKPTERTASQINSNSPADSRRSSAKDISSFVVSDKENFKFAKHVHLATSEPSTAVKRLSDTDSIASDGMAADSQRLSDTPSETDSEKSSQVPKSAVELAFQKQQIYRSLCKTELSFCEALHQGIEAYYRPLADCILSTDQHNMLFQNIYQLCSISEILVSRLGSCQTATSPGSSSYLCDVPGVFVERLEELCQAYEAYCVGVRDAVQLLGELKSYDGFEAFVQELRASKDQPSLGNWIQKPVEHIKDLTILLMKAYKCTPTNNPEYTNLQKIVKALRKTTAIISDEYIRRSQTTLSSLSILSPSEVSVATPSRMSKLSHNSSQSSGSSSSDSSTSSGSSGSLDVEVVEIQKKLRFNRGVQNYNLMKTNRHVIYKGDLLLSEDEQTHKVFAILMSDLLLLTKQSDPDGDLTVLQDPVLLHDIKECTQGEWHPSEFTLRVECHHCEPLGVAPRFYTFRAPSLELKCVWKNIIQHRLGRSRNSPHNLPLSKTTDVV